MIKLKKIEFNMIKYKLDTALTNIKEVQSFLKSYNERQRAFLFKKGWKELNNKPFARTAKELEIQRTGHSG